LHDNSTVIKYTIIHVQKSTFQFQLEKMSFNPVFKATRRVGRPLDSELPNRPLTDGPVASLQKYRPISGSVLKAGIVVSPPQPTRGFGECREGRNPGRQRIFGIFAPTKHFW